MSETGQLLDKAVLRTVRTIIMRDLELPVPRPTSHELAVLRSIAHSAAASFGTKACAVRALRWLASGVSSEGVPTPVEG